MPPSFPASFQPHRFFRGRTLGAGFVPSPFGRSPMRCVIETNGWLDSASGAMHFDETYAYEDGRTDTLHWALDVEGDKVVGASELSVVGRPRSRLEGPDWRVVFRRVGVPPAPSLTLTFDALFSQVAEDTVMKHVTVSVLGVAFGHMEAFHRRVGPAGAAT